MPDRYQRIKRVLDEVLAQPADARSAFLDAKCGDDVELRDQVQDLLRYAEDPSSFLEEPQDSATASRIPERVAGFRIVRRLGEGGMGTVFEAEQDAPRRRVALKVIRPGLGSPSGIRRFELEAEILGRLKHPGIAHVYAAGTGDWGAGPQPYLAMELASGQPLTDYAKHASLDMQQRAALLASICDAVEHAHRRGIVHRDLKPQNILVDADGPKVLDFGIARVLDPDAQMTHQLTREGQIVGTLAYMSPEQAAGDADEVDTRTDVYALGAIGYELATGTLPLPVAGKTLLEAARIVREEAPRDPRKIAAEVPADLAAILIKAVEKDADDRYASAHALAADLRAFVEHRPIAARPATMTRRLRRWMRREPWKATLAAVLVVASFALTALGAYITASAPIVAAGEAKLRRDRVDSALQRGFELQQAGDFVAAVAAFDEGLADEPDHVELIAGRVFSMPIADAHGWLDARHQTGTPPRALDRLRAYVLERTGDRDAATELSKRIGEPQETIDLVVAGWIELGRVPRTHESRAKAVRLFSRAQLRFRVPNFLTLAVLAEVGASVGELQLAKDAANALMELWPDNTFGPSAAASVLAKQNEPEKGIQLIRDWLRNRKTDATKLQFRLAELLFITGRIDESIEVLRGICERLPQDGLAYSRLAVPLASRGEHEAAITACRKALERGVQEPQDTYANWGRAHMLRGEAELAESQFRKALTLSPTHENAHRGLLHVLTERADGDAMRTEVQRWIRIRPDDPTRHVTLARFYLESPMIGTPADPKAALAAARDAVRLSKSRDPLALWTLARAHFALGQFDAAKSVTELAFLQLEVTENPPPGLRSSLKTLMRKTRRALRKR